jgi:LPS O-antigen subunit length determinant protein (WzzB/FepE family)
MQDVQRDSEGQLLEKGLVREGGDGASCNSPPAATKSDTFEHIQAVNALKKKLAGEESETLRLQKELEIQVRRKLMSLLVRGKVPAPSFHV